MFRIAMFYRDQEAVVTRANLTILRHRFWITFGWPPMDKKSRPCKYTP